MSSPAIRLAVFDLDDTLYLERDFVRSGVEAVARRLHRLLGLDGFVEPAWRIFTSGRGELIIDRALEALGIEPPPSLIRSLLRCYRTHTPDIELSRDAKRFLARPPAGVTLGILTDGRPVTQRLKVRALGLDERVSAVVYSGQWGPRYAKPHPRAYRILQKRFGVPPSACLYVGDHPGKDFQGPLRLGWSVCRIRRPGGIFESLDSRGTAEIRSLDELASRFRFARD